MNDRDRQLLDQWLDGEAEAQEVYQLLHSDPQAVSWLTERAALHADLHQALSRRKLQRALLPQPPQVSTRRFTKAVFWAAAAAVIVGLILSFLVTRPTGVTMEIIACDDAGSNWQIGRKESLRTLDLSQGHLTLRSDTGVTLDVFGPASLHFRSSMLLELSKGKITVDVGAQGKGFTVVTEQTRVVDLGTIFGVEASPSATTDVVVFSGEVELHDDAPAEKLTTGHAVRIRKGSGRSRIENVVTSRRRAEWSTAPPPSTCSIATVVDRMERGIEPFSYHIMPNGFVEGAKAFVELPYIFKDVPQTLIGADLVQTFRGARKNRRFQMEVTLSRAATLYILVDQTSPPPSWLAQNFRKTAETLTLSSPDPSIRRTIPYEVWQREMPSGGAITLGPARESPDEKPMMYVLAAKPLK